MTYTNFLQVVEYIDDQHLGDIGDESIYAMVGKTTKKLLGFEVRAKDGKRRHIYFHDIDNMKRIIEGMEMRRSFFLFGHTL
jgi:hypothetical protein